MNRLAHRLILLFLAATLAPLAVTWWIAASLIEHSLKYSATDQLDAASRTMESAGREIYQRACDSLRRDAQSGRAGRTLYTAAGQEGWPSYVREFWESGEEERFSLASGAEDAIQYLVRRKDGVAAYASPLGFSLSRLGDQYRQARESVERARARDLRRGLLTTLASLGAAVWAVSLAVLILMARRVSRPIQELTTGLSRLADGDLGARLETRRTDEVGKAVGAFNDMAAQLEHSRNRLVYLAQLASWQSLARKMAHELKNSLTPIRLTMEEIVARRAGGDPALVEQAAQIAVEEVESLERRVRAFSEFAAEPPVRRQPLDLNAAVEERIALLKAGHPEVEYRTRLAESRPLAPADEDLLKGILTNLLENAAEAAGAGGAALVRTSVEDGCALIEVHDSGPGLSAEARRSLFEPTISFKAGGMGLGLSIARKNALLLGGDILLVAGELGGAAFRVSLPLAPANRYQLSGPGGGPETEPPHASQPTVSEPAAGWGRRR